MRTIPVPCGIYFPLAPGLSAALYTALSECLIGLQSMSRVECPLRSRATTVLTLLPTANSLLLREAQAEVQEHGRNLEVAGYEQS